MPDATAPPSPRIVPLFGLLPFLRPYAGRWALAFLVLVTAAGATLALPVTFKYLIDRGFAAGNPAHIDYYFLALFSVSLALAGATALCFYLVSWLGERVTANLRRAVYEHVLGMSPQFFETTQMGEGLSRLTTDTTLIQTVVGTSRSMGLRNFFLLAGGVAMLAVTSSRCCPATFWSCWSSWSRPSSSSDGARARRPRRPKSISYAVHVGIGTASTQSSSQADFMRGLKAVPTPFR